jgi:hypothetical protein
MSFIELIAKMAAHVPKVAVGVLLGVIVFGVFTVGFDQGEVFGFTVPTNSTTT